MTTQLSPINGSSTMWALYAAWLTAIAARKGVTDPALLPSDNDTEQMQLKKLATIYYL